MVDIASRPAPTARNGASAPKPREVRRRRSLPGSRAVVGGFLVVAAAVGTFGAYAAANGGPSESYVVLTRDVSPGERLLVGDLALVEADLPAQQRATVLADLAVATGAVAVSPLEEGQLLATSDVVKLAGVVGRGQLSIPVEPARSNNGQLTPGELVDVIATATSAGSTVTETIARDAVVVRIFSGDQSLGSTSSVVVTLSLAAGELEPVADAAAGATISLARVSGLDRARAGEAVVGGAEDVTDGGAEAGADAVEVDGGAGDPVDDGGDAGAPAEPVTENTVPGA